MTTPEPPSLAPIAAALLDTLNAGTPEHIAFGDLGAPPGAGDLYGFLTRVDLAWSGSWANPHEMATVVYQAQCVGLDAAGVEALEHLVRVLLAPAPSVAGWQVIDWESLGGPGIRVDRDTTPERAYSTPRWRLIAQPTEET